MTVSLKLLLLSNWNPATYCKMQALAVHLFLIFSLDCCKIWLNLVTIQTRPGRTHTCSVLIKENNIHISCMRCDWTNEILGFSPLSWVCELVVYLKHFCLCFLYLTYFLLLFFVIGRPMYQWWYNCHMSEEVYVIGLLQQLFLAYEVSHFGKNQQPLLVLLALHGFFLFVCSAVVHSCVLSLTHSCLHLNWISILFFFVSLFLFFCSYFSFARQSWLILLLNFKIVLFLAHHVRIRHWFYSGSLIGTSFNQIVW